MVVVIERDRRLARKLLAALAEHGCKTRVAYGYAQGVALLSDERPDALYVSEALPRQSGADLLATYDRDDRFAQMPALVRVSRQDSVFARAMRRGGLQTIVAPIDVERTASTLARMESGEEGTLRKLVHQSRTLHARTRKNRDGVEVTVATTKRLRDRLAKK